MAKNQFYTSLDIGSSKIRTLVGVMEEGQATPLIIGMGMANSNGFRKGQVVDLEEVINNISQSLEEAERMSGEPINHVTVGVSGSHLASHQARGVIAVSGEEVTPDDVERVLESAQSFEIQSNQRVLKIIPKSFSVDIQEHVRYPVGMIGKKLEVQATILTAQLSAIKNLEKCVYESGIDIDDLVPCSLAVSEAVLQKRQKELGVVVADIGAGTTSLAVYEEGNLVHAAVIPVGGESVTNDVAIGLRTSIDLAEKVKIQYGTCLLDEIGTGKEEIDLSLLSKTDNAKVDRRYLVQIIEARYYEILSMIKRELKSIGRDGMLPSGIILTGGGAKIPGIVERARDVLGLPAAIGYPSEAAGLVDRVDDPAFATAYGLLLWSVRNAGSSGPRTKLQLGKHLGKATDWIRKMLP